MKRLLAVFLAAGVCAVPAFLKAQGLPANVLFGVTVIVVGGAGPSVLQFAHFFLFR